MTHDGLANLISRVDCDVVISSSITGIKEVIEGFFKQANIKNKYIDSSLDKLDKKNFSFVDFTVDEAVEYLSSKYNVQFSVEMIGKKKIYNVEPKKK
jgi:hypothetical protein